MIRSRAAPPSALDPTTRRLILLLPAAFLAHDLGELVGNDELNRAAHDLTRRFPVLAQRALPHFTTSRAQAAVAIGTLATGVTLLSWRAARSAPRSPAMTTYAAATLLLGAHMVPHTAHAIALRRVLPGLVGGLTVSLPYSALVIGRLLRHGLVEPGALARARGRALRCWPGAARGASPRPVGSVAVATGSRPAPRRPDRALIWNGMSRGRFPLVDGMVCGQLAGRARARDGDGWVAVGRAMTVEAGQLWGWHDAPGQCGSAGRHTDIRGLGPHVGDTQEGAPD